MVLDRLFKYLCEMLNFLWIMLWGIHVLSLGYSWRRHVIWRHKLVFFSVRVHVSFLIVTDCPSVCLLCVAIRISFVGGWYFHGFLIVLIGLILYVCFLRYVLIDGVLVVWVVRCLYRLWVFLCPAV